MFFNTIRLRSKNIFFHGGILAFYVIAVITTFILGVYGFVRMIGVDFSSVVDAPSKSMIPSNSGYDYRFIDNTYVE